ncbi:transposase [Myxococcota bacterium]|nr:transposase [Myxococcota bacterium]
MKGQRFSEEQIIGILNEAEQTGSIREVCKRNNITETTFYRWRTKFGGMEVSDAKRLRELEHENARLKKMVAELSLDNRMLKDLNSKNGGPGGTTTRSGLPRDRARRLRTESLPSRGDPAQLEASSVRPNRGSRSGSSCSRALGALPALRLPQDPRDSADRRNSDRSGPASIDPKAGRPPGGAEDSKTASAGQEHDDGRSSALPEPRMELRLRGGPDGRRTTASIPDGDRRVHAGIDLDRDGSVLELERRRSCPRAVNRPGIAGGSIS